MPPLRLAARRLKNGKPLLAAIHAAELNRLTLAAKTKEIDPDGRGVSHQLIAALTTSADWGRNATTPGKAELIAKALGKPVGSLFKMPTQPTP